MTTTGINPCKVMQMLKNTSFPSCFISATPLSSLAVGLWGVAVYNDNNHKGGLFNNIQYIHEYIGCITGDNVRPMNLIHSLFVCFMQWVV